MMTIRANAIFLAALLALSAPAAAVTDRGLTEFGRIPASADTAWNGSHRNVMNQDFIPITTTHLQEFAWEALERQGMIPGAAQFFPLSQGENGIGYTTSSRGPGFSHLHAIDLATGAVVWESTPWASEDDTENVSAKALGHPPSVDSDGNVYTSDGTNIYSFTADGQLRWKTNYNQLVGAEEPFIGMVFTKDGLALAGPTPDGFLLAFNRADGSLYAEPLQLPDAVVVPCAIEPITSLTFWQGGEVYEPYRDEFLCATLGLGFPSVNSPALDPVAGRVIFTYAGETADTTRLLAYEFVDDPSVPSGRRAEQVWETVIGPRSGTTPTLSQDLQRIYVGDSDQVAYQIDAGTGEVLFQTEPGTVQNEISATLDADDGVYSCARRTATKLDGSDLSTIWQIGPEEFDAIASQFLPVGPVVPLLVPDPRPIGVCVSATAPIGPDKITFGLILGYDNLFSPFTGNTPIPKEQIILMADQKTGEIIEDSILAVPRGGTQDGGSMPSEDGGLISFRLEATCSPYFYLGNSIFPEFYHVEECLGGVWATRPVSQVAAALSGLDGAVQWNDESLDRLDVKKPTEADLQRAFEKIGYSRSQIMKHLEPVLDVAVSGGEISVATRNAVQAKLDVAFDELGQARDLLLQPRVRKKDLDRVREAVNEANDALEEARALLS
jgi:outer membrane protein assembly factor BamB